MATHTITQGSDCTIHVRGIKDAAGAALNPTGWTVRAQARSGPDSSLLAEWRSGAGLWGVATTDADGVHLAVPAAMSDPWTWGTAKLHVEITEPVLNGRQARPGEGDLILDRAIVHD